MTKRDSHQKSRQTPHLRVPFLRPGITDKDIARMVASIKTGWLVHGRETEILERELAQYLGAADVAMVGSCTAALHIALMLLDVKRGDEVITTPMSWVATSNVILHRGAKVVFADVDKDTGLLSLKEIEKKITSRTKAIIIVHYCGAMADMKSLKRLADKHHIHIIEDSAHALESMRDGIRPGKYGISCLSFHSAKNITSGQGGAIVVNDKKLAEQARILRRDGVINRDGKRVMVSLGDKLDSTDFQAALLIGQLGRIKNTHKKRQQVFLRYAKAFSKAGIDFPKFEPLAGHACHMFTVLVDPEKRDEVRKRLAERGIDTSIHYPPIHLEPYYREKFGYKKGDFPNAEYIGARTITLPTYPGLTAIEQMHVIKSVIEVTRSIK